MPIDIHLKQIMDEKDEKYGGDEMYRMLGPTVLSWASVDSSRAYMFTSNLKQTLTLLNPDVPRLGTNFEKSIGKYNRDAFKFLPGQWEVIKIIDKFPGVPKENQIYTIVFYNREKDLYDMIERPIAENRTEKFGFTYNTSVMNALEEGDVVGDTVLYKTTSYDEHMNYRYGKNARVYYSTSTDTIEDAIVVRKGWADSVKSVEVDNIQVSINDNDVMLNMYGDDRTYKPFPDIGEKVRDSLLCATRRINKSHLLFDFQQSHLREIGDVDSDYYTSKNSVIYDINVYYNGDDPLPDTIFYQQIKQYLEANAQYAAKILEICDMIKESGSSYTDNVTEFRSLYRNYNNPEYKWKNKDKVFSHLMIEFKVKSIVGLDLGAKLTGRYGNKGVISRISEGIPASESENDDDWMSGIPIEVVDDERMPYYIMNGERIYADVLLNASGSVRRLNPGQLTEVELNFIAEQIVDKIRKCDTMEEKAEIAFKFLKMVNIEQGEYFQNLYNTYPSDTSYPYESKQALIRDIEENGFYLIRAPHKPVVKDDIDAIYAAFPDIRPVPIHIDLFGIQGRTMLRPGIIGYEYMLVLKQNSNKNFSARSTYRVNRSNLPVKDIAKKTNRSPYAKTPVRLSEIYNILCAVDPVTYATNALFMRNSALARKSLDSILYAPGNPLHVKKLKLTSNYTNANVMILQARLKCMGLRLRLLPSPDGYTHVYDDNVICAMHFGDYTIYDYPRNRGMYRELFDRFYAKMNSFIVVESYPGEKHDIAWDDVFENEEIQKKYNISDDVKNLLKNATKTSARTLSEKINKMTSRKSVAALNADGSVPKKRGRKSKAELERLRILQEQEDAQVDNDVSDD